MSAHQEASADTFVISRVFNAPRQRVWDAWTKPDQLAHWLGPKGVTATVLAHDLRPGGALHVRMASPDGGVMWAKFVYREVDAPSRLVWAHAFADAQANVIRAPFFEGKWPLELLTTVTFAEERGGTRVTLTWVPLDATEDERQTFIGNTASMQQGWTGSFDALEALLAQG